MRPSRMKSHISSISIIHQPSMRRSRACSAAPRSPNAAGSRPTARHFTGSGAIPEAAAAAPADRGGGSRESASGRRAGNRFDQIADAVAAVLAPVWCLGRGGIVGVGDSRGRSLGHRPGRVGRHAVLVDELAVAIIAEISLVIGLQLSFGQRSRRSGTARPAAWRRPPSYIGQTRARARFRPATPAPSANRRGPSKCRW